MKFPLIALFLSGLLFRAVQCAVSSEEYPSTDLSSLDHDAPRLAGLAVGNKVEDPMDRREIDVQLSTWMHRSETVLAAGSGTFLLVAISWGFVTWSQKRLYKLLPPEGPERVYATKGTLRWKTLGTVGLRKFNKVAGVTAVAAIVLSLLAIAYLQIWGVPGQATATPVHESLLKGVPVAKLVQEACSKLNDLAVRAEGDAREPYTDGEWNQHWDNFKVLFEAAQDEANRDIVNDITNLPTDAWPALAVFPVSPNGTDLNEHAEYEAKIQKWGAENALVIPHLKHGIEVQYQDSHYNRTLEAIWLKNGDANFVDHSVAFEKLTRVFVYAASVPEHCLPWIKESPETKAKMAKLRAQKKIRADRFKLVLQKNFDLRTETTRKSFL